MVSEQIHSIKEQKKNGKQSKTLANQKKKRLYFICLFETKMEMIIIIILLWLLLLFTQVVHIWFLLFFTTLCVYGVWCGECGWLLFQLAMAF